MKKLLASLSVSVILSGGFVTEKANAKDVTDFRSDCNREQQQ